VKGSEQPAVARSAVNRPAYLSEGQLRAEYTKLLRHPDKTVAKAAAVRLSFLGPNNYPKPATKIVPETPENSQKTPPDTRACHQLTTSGRLIAVHTLRPPGTGPMSPDCHTQPTIGSG